MKLVTFDDGLVGKVVGDKVVELDVPDMRRYFELGGEVGETGREFALDDVRLRAPIVPKKFFHTAGNFREHDEESKNVNWSHPVLPWIVFFQNIDAIIGPDDAIIYPEALTNDLQRHHRARHPARRDEVGRVLSVEEHRHVLPDRPVDRDAR
jgi:2-keto-4-pentenoate hydratase/2-oxohepta-3-ene-1,7-dioic acid hydratase in catechol pathway